MKTHERIIVLGVTATGKSQWVKSLLAGELRRGSRVVALDCTDEYSQLAQHADGRKGPLAQRMTASTLAREAQAGRCPFLQPRFSIAVVPDDMTSTRSSAQAFELTASLLCFTPNPCIIVADEAHRWAPHALERLNDCATVGGQHWGAGCALIVVSQRANRVPLTVRSQASTIVSFRQTEVADLKALEERCGEQFASRVRGLPDHAFEVWTPTTQSPQAAAEPAEQSKEKAV